VVSGDPSLQRIRELYLALKGNDPVIMHQIRALVDARPRVEAEWLIVGEVGNAKRPPRRTATPLQVNGSSYASASGSGTVSIPHQVAMHASQKTAA
jgi:hypothetical protein